MGIAMKHLVPLVTAAAAVLMLAACSEAPKPVPEKAAETAKEPPKPPEPVAAQTAFYEMYKPARTWATDVLPLSMSSQETKSLKSADGKAPVWTAVFVSPSRREARVLVYSAVDEGTELHKGVTATGAQPWSGSTAKSQPFQNSEFAVNSDAAYKTALAKAAVWVKKHPGVQPQMYLGKTSKDPAPVWFLLWGTTKNGFAVYVNATSGKAK